MAEATDIQLNNLQSVDISNSVENTNGSENETEINYCETPLMEDKKKYMKLKKVIYMLGVGVLLLSIQAYLAKTLAFLYAYDGHYWLFLKSYGTILGSNVFIVTITRAWKFTKEENKITSILLGLVSVLFSTEILIYYWKLNRQVMLRTTSRAHYKQTLQHVEDLQNLLYIVTLQAMLIFFLQLIYLNNTVYLYSRIEYTIMSVQIAMMVITIITLIYAIVIYKCYNYNEELAERHRVTLMTLALTCLSAVLYIGDVVSDVILAGKFFYYKLWLYACLTLSFVIMPGIYTIWVNYYRTGEKSHNCGIFNIVIIVFNLDPLFGYWKSLKLIREIKKIEQNEPLNSGYSEERKERHIELVENNHNVAVSTYYASCTESTMQLILQTVILLTEFINNEHICIPDLALEQIVSDVYKLFTIGSSFISVTISPVKMLRSKRIAQNINNEELQEDDPLKLGGIIIQFMGYFFVMLTRIFAISIAAWISLYVTTGVLIANWIVVLCFLIFKDRKNPVMYNLFQSFIYTFTPPINTFTTEMIFQALYLLQNVLAILFYANFSIAVRCVSLYVTPVSNIIGIGFRILYQKNFGKYIKISID